MGSATDAPLYIYRGQQIHIKAIKMIHKNLERGNLIVELATKLTEAIDKLEAAPVDSICLSMNSASHVTISAEKKIGLMKQIHHMILDDFKADRAALELEFKEL